MCASKCCHVPEVWAGTGLQLSRYRNCAGEKTGWGIRLCCYPMYPIPLCKQALVAMFFTLVGIALFKKLPNNRKEPMVSSHFTKWGCSRKWLWLLKVVVYTVLLSDSLPPTLRNFNDFYLLVLHLRYEIFSSRILLEVVKGKLYIGKIWPYFIKTSSYYSITNLWWIWESSLK